VVAVSAAEIVKTLDPSDWQHLSAGDGTKGPRLHDWCYLELADLAADEFNAANHGLWTRGLLIRRNMTDGEFAYLTTWCPAGTSIGTLVNVEGHRWSIEDSFETAKNEFGLDRNEARSWHGWHRHEGARMARGRAAVSIELDEAEQTALSALTRRHGAAQSLAMRARIVLGAADGLTNKEIAAKLDVGAHTVGAWRKRFASDRMDGLYDEPRPGAPRQIGDEEIAATVRKTLETLPKEPRTGACGAWPRR